MMDNAFLIHKTVHDHAMKEKFFVVIIHVSQIFLNVQIHNVQPVFQFVVPMDCVLNLHLCATNSVHNKMNPSLYGVPDLENASPSLLVVQWNALAMIHGVKLQINV